MWRKVGGIFVSGGLHEFAYIDWLRERGRAHPRLTLGIGDDAAVWRFPQPADSLLAVDMLMEGTDFTFPEVTPRQAGRKALAVNLSDLAAMAGRPLAALASVAFPRRYGVEFARDLHCGLQELADEFDVALAGGDTNIWDGPLVVSVTVVGEATERGPVRRSGARAGDWILVTGTFGGSIGGHHYSFRPRVVEALALHATVALHAMIDVSDGLAADLYHILDESRVGAIVHEEAIPISQAAQEAGDARSPLDHALGDGEDFELIFTVSPEDGRRLLREPPFETPLSRIGEIVAGGGAELVTPAGERRPLPRAGWEHSF